MAGTRNPWLLRAAPRSTEATVRVLAFPHAGGGASSFRTLGRAMPAHVDFLAVQLPGREARLAEASLVGPRVIAEAALAGLGEVLDGPLVLLGHSAGAVIAYEFARLLTAQGRAPRLLAASGHRAPHLPTTEPACTDLDDAAFLAFVQRYDGLPAELLASPELLELVLPALRADFESDLTYVHDAALGRCGCPILALHGAFDPSVPRAEMDAWQVHADRGFQLVSLPGGHFPHLEGAGAERVVGAVLDAIAGSGRSPARAGE